MASLSWWRSWHGAPMDHKYQVIGAKAGVKVGIVSAVMWALLDYASQNDPRGSVEGFDVEIYAVYSGFTEDEISAVIRVMGDKGIIENGRLVNWEKRQPKREDDSRARVTKFREMKRNVTHGNAPDTDTDKDKDKEVQQPQNIFAVYEREIGALTPIIRDELIAAESDYPEEWIISALQESARQNKRN